MNLITLRGRWKQKSRVLQRKWKLYLLFAVSLQLQPAKLNHIMNVKGLLNRNAIVIFLVFGIVWYFVDSGARLSVESAVTFAPSTDPKNLTN